LHNLLNKVQFDARDGLASRSGIRFLRSELKDWAGIRTSDERVIVLPSAGMHPRNAFALTRLPINRIANPAPNWRPLRA
jgi:hypothetical protein